MAVVPAAPEEVSKSLASVLVLGLEERSALPECLPAAGCELDAQESDCPVLSLPLRCCVSGERCVLVLLGLSRV